MFHMSHSRMPKLKAFKGDGRNRSMAAGISKVKMVNEEDSRYLE